MDNKRRLQEWQQQRAAREAEKAAREAAREAEIFGYMIDSNLLEVSVVDSLVQSGKTLSDLLQYHPDKLVSEFYMEAQHATEFLKGRITKKPRLDNEEPHYVNQRVLANKCFKVPFQGTAHQELHNQLVKHRATMASDVHYSPYCALVQSSGMGKSRALMELSELDVYVCYCSLASHTATAFPPRTGGLADKLASTFTEHGMVFYLKAWLSILADCISTTSPEAWKQYQLPDEHGFPKGDLAEKILKEWMKSDLDDTYKGKDIDKWSTASCSEVIKSIEKALQKKCRQCSPDEKTECKHTLAVSSLPLMKQEGCK
ncbi:hypothetical protein GOP47_0021205 [Adiantum capillus-veneris]|uniref:Uncharacterized protein n=1 Tax=Adiantum capillus-veneris TaxID=13818 RepID=A0A9D4UAX7_ADICA|nr:hypothetical protein GOP47_0021205 [Adiantum capillus-veneris]